MDDPNTIEEYDRLWSDDAFYERYMRNKRGFYVEVGAHALKHMPAGSPVVDVGCGAAGALSALAGLGVSQRLLYGIDYSIEAIKRARAALPHATFAVEDLHETILPRGIFGLVLCTETLEHVADYERALAVLYNLCAPGGSILITVPLDDRAPDPRHINEWSLKEFRALLKPWGLTHVQVFQDKFILVIVRKRSMLIPQIVVRRYTDAKGPFLSVVTRHHLRGNDRVRMMDVNRDSIKRFDDPDCEHVILVDDAARGIEYANGMLYAQRGHINGEWIWILDDDEAAVAPGLIGALKAIVEEQKPDVVMVKHDRTFHVPNLIMPTEAVWETDRACR